MVEIGAIFRNRESSKVAWWGALPYPSVDLGGLEKWGWAWYRKGASACFPPRMSPMQWTASWGMNNPCTSPVKAE